MENFLGVSWVWWLLGTLGIGGTIALAILAPAVLEIIWSTILKIIGGLLQTRIGVAILVGIATFVTADIHRSRLDQAELEAQKAAFEQKQKQRDEQIAIETRKAVEEALAQQKVADAAIDKDVKDFKDALPPVPATGNPFAVGPDACRLRAIAGLPCSKPERPARVPAPRPRRASPIHH